MFFILNIYFINKINIIFFIIYIIQLKIFIFYYIFYTNKYTYLKL